MAFWIRPSRCARRMATAMSLMGAEAFAMAGEGVMEPPAQIEAEALLERVPHGQDGPTGGVPVGLRHLLGIRNLQPQKVLGS